MAKLGKITTPTVWKRWVENAENFPNREAIVHYVAGEEPVRWTFKELVDTANRFSCLIRAMGIQRNDVCAIIIRHNRLFYPLYMGIVGAGAIPAVLAYPNPRLHPDKFRQGIMGMSQRSGLDWIFTEQALEPIISPLLQNSTIKGMHFPLDWDIASPPDDFLLARVQEIRDSIKHSEPVLLQHSSGTTGLQKPVLLSHRAILEHVTNYCDSIDFSAEDKVASWLPLYHDMGLIAAFHLPLAYGITSIQIDPFEWVIAPVLLLEAISKEKATLCWLPNFAFNMLADKIPDDELEGINLQSLRLTVNCSEPVRDESHHRFLDRFEKYGFREKALSACYAMAETTYAVTQTIPGEHIPVLSLDKTALAQGKVKRAAPGSAVRTVVSSGKLIPGCAVKIVDENRQPVAEDSVGEIAILSVSMFDGYRNYPEKTADVMQDGWYFSGDFGFVRDGHYYIIGRKKDIIIVAGKNIYPEDVEATVSKVDQVIPGRVVALGIDDDELGTEVLSVVAETAVENPAEKKALAVRIVQAGLADDEAITRVYLVPPRWLIKSSAGKPSRKANKERIVESDEFLVR